MVNDFPRALTFDDVLIRPSSSDIEPREASLVAEVARRFFIAIPILSAAMDRVTGAKMAIALGKLGGLGVLHRNCTVAQQVVMIKKAKRRGVKIGAACGPFDAARAKALENAGCDILIIDCAHGHNKKVIKSARAIKKMLRRPKLVVGNIATKEAARDLALFADGIKVGVGPGSICTTRIVSGVGIPQFSAILEVASVTKKYSVPVIADGGIRSSGDIVKALAAGASAVMLGNLLAGTDEAPGTLVIKNGIQYKEYRGMGSRAALASKLSSDRYLGKGKAMVPEGVEALIAYRGSVKSIIENLIGGIQVGMGYIGAKTIPDIGKRAHFVYITKAAVREGQPHNLDKIIR